MKLDQSIYHLVIFLASLASLTALILTGHDNSPLLHQITGGLLGGVIGGSGAGAAPLIGRFFAGPPSPPSPPPARQSGRVRLPMLLFVSLLSLGVAACASFGQAAKLNPVATACASASVAVKSVTAARTAGVLTPVQIGQVNQALAVIAPVCLAPSQPTVDSATLLALTAAASTLQDIATVSTPIKGNLQP